MSRPEASQERGLCPNGWGRLDSAARVCVPSNLRAAHLLPIRSHRSTRHQVVGFSGLVSWAVPCPRLCCRLYIHLLSTAGARGRCRSWSGRGQEASSRRTSAAQSDIVSPCCRTLRTGAVSLRRRPDRGRRAGSSSQHVHDLAAVSQKFCKSLAARRLMLDAPSRGARRAPSMPRCHQVCVVEGRLRRRGPSGGSQALGKTITHLGPLAAGGSQARHQIIVR